MFKSRCGTIMLLVLTAAIMSCLGSALELSASNGTNVSNSTNVSNDTNVSNGTNVSEMPPVQLAGEPQDNTLLYSDDFSDPESGWLVSSTEEQESDYQDGKYYITVLIPDRVVSTTIPESRIFKDFTVEAKVDFADFPADGKYGLDLRNDFANTGDTYRIYLYGDGYYKFLKWVNSKWTTLISRTKSSAIKTGTGNNTIKVSAIGNTFTIYVNDKKLGKVVDKSIPSGEIGLLAETPLTNSTVKVGFDSLKVWAVNSTATTGVNT